MVDSVYSTDGRVRFDIYSVNRIKRTIKVRDSRCGTSVPLAEVHERDFEKVEVPRGIEYRFREGKTICQI